MSVTEQHISDFIEHGFTIVEGVLSEQEVDVARNAFHQQLFHDFGINHDEILNSGKTRRLGVRKKSHSASNEVRFSKWKLDVHAHPSVFQAMSDVHKCTFSSGEEPGFEHPFGSYDSQNLLMFCDAVAYRMPDHIQCEGGLGLHIDRNPLNPYTHIPFFRPIQGFVALTDHLGSDSGGLCVVPGYHMKCEQYFAKHPQIESKGGNFFRLPHSAHGELYEKLEVLPYVPKGSLVLFDNRLPHATTEWFRAFDTREVVYTGFLPPVELNYDFVKKQREDLITYARFGIDDMTNLQCRGLLFTPHQE